MVYQYFNGKRIYKYFKDPVDSNYQDVLQKYESSYNVKKGLLVKYKSQALHGYQLYNDYTEFYRGCLMNKSIDRLVCKDKILGY